MITEPVLLKYLHGKAAMEGVPLAITLELTGRCNMDCKMCYIHSRNADYSKELSTEQWISIIDSAAESGTLFVLITGGEPFIRSDFRDIYRECRNKGMLVSINTNATLISKDDILFLKKDPPLRINVSLYGTSAQTYERLCGNGKMYDRAFKNVRKLKEAGLPVKINYTVSEINSCDISSMYEYIGKENLHIQSSTYTFNPVRKCGSESCSFIRADAQKSAELTAECDRCENGRDRFIEQVNSIENNIKKAAQERIKNENTAGPMRCRAGKSALWISWDGKMMMSGMIPDIYSDVLELGFDKSWEEIRCDSTNVSVPGECSICEYRCICDVCPASCIAETGSTDSPPEYQCLRAKELYKVLIKKRDQIFEADD